MATKMRQELAAVIDARMQAAKGPDEVREVLRQLATALAQLTGLVQILLAVTQDGLHAGGPVRFN